MVKETLNCQILLLLRLFSLTNIARIVNKPSVILTLSLCKFILTVLLLTSDLLKNKIYFVCNSMGSILLIVIFLVSLRLSGLSHYSPLILNIDISLNSVFELHQVFKGRVQGAITLLIGNIFQLLGL